jgi:hypothetical protein
MPIETDGDGTNDNEGPHCRNCHVGASNCDVCHADDSTNFSAAYTATITAAVTGKSNYAPQAFIRQSAVADLNGQCIDGGFSFPHRTLGANMLKDEIFGVDFDGDPVAAGQPRGTNGGAEAAQDTTFSVNTDGFAYWTGEKQNATSIIPSVRTDSGAIESANAENMDSVCIDCHGDATYWNGENAAFLNTTPDSALPLGTYGSGQRGGWELILKGLP